MASDTALVYPFDRVPDPGELAEVAPGVRWLRMPLPFSLDHINLWLLEDGDGVFLVDTGLATDESVNIWSTVYQRYYENKNVTGVLVTHMHPDHLGLAGWLTAKTGSELWMSRGEYLTCGAMLADSHSEAPPVAVDFYRRAGFSQQQMESYRARFGSFGNFIRNLPKAYRRLRENDTLNLAGAEWRVIIGEGHSPEHVCLLSESLNLFISGDQLLPRISSNISVWPIEPHANPLQLWLDSCQKLLDQLPEDVLVLPAHGMPFVGAHLRLQALIDEHEGDLVSLREFCREPRRAVDAFPVLFRAKIDSGNELMAVGESLAHLRCLVARGHLTVSRDKEGVDWYQSV